MKIFAVLWFLFMTTLSHIPGGPSGEESRMLSQMTGVDEGILRSSAHCFCFAVLGYFVITEFPEINIWLKILFLAVWCILDEVTKIPVPGRHFSLFDAGLNLIGTVIGVAVGLKTGLRNL